MDLSIIIVSWNVKEKLRANLKSILASDDNLEKEVFVVDNKSSDGSAEMVWKEFPAVTFIANNSNLGFAKANNQAIAESKGRYVLLLNPDMRVFPNTFRNMVGWMDAHPEAGIAGCRLEDERGDIVPHVRRFPMLFDQLMLVLKIPHFLPSALDDYLMKDFDYSKEAQVDSIRGSFFMIRREAIKKIGLLDEQYFIWFEEVDYCLRAAKAGIRTFYTPAARCIDHVGSSFALLPRGRKQVLFRDSMLKYFKKWRPGYEYLALKLAWTAIFIIISIAGRGSDKE